MYRLVLRVDCSGVVAMTDADFVFDGENVDGSGTGTIKITCMHDPYDLRCPVCGGSVFSQLTNAALETGNSFACETCGIQICIFPDRCNCRFLMEVQGA